MKGRANEINIKGVYMDNLIIWVGFVSMFAIMLYGVSKSVPKRNKYSKVNRYDSAYPKYIRSN